MLQSGEDPRYTARAHDPASPRKTLDWPTLRRWWQALAAAEAYERLGSPEGELALLQAAVYLATAPQEQLAL